LSITIGARERVCVIGRNGKGKTTLLKLLAGLLLPQNGEAACHPGVTRGCFEQTNIKNLVDTRTVEEEILYSHPDVDRQQARNICGAMMFEGDDALKRIGVLSGGEKSRVMLGKLLVTPVNLLLLDEPTNHLDMYSCDALLAAIDSFKGAVVMVTHNEMLLHALADRLIVFQNDRVSVFEGSYQRFMEKGGWGDEVVAKSAQKDTDEEPSSVKVTKKEKRQRRSAIIIERAKIQKPLEKRIVQVESEIEAHEKVLNELNDAMQEASQAQDGKGIAKISQSIHHFRSAIDRLFNELETLTTTLNEQSALFQERLDQLDRLGDS
jgi:ATP-binding cassette subfamily F protein 3